MTSPPWCHLAWCQLARQAEHDPAGALVVWLLAVLVAVAVLALIVWLGGQE